MDRLNPTRRYLIKLAAFAPALGMAAPVQAALSAPSGAQAPGFHRFMLGDAAITVLSDGHFMMPVADVGVNADPAEVQAFLRARHLSTDLGYRHTNHLFVELGAAKVLVDVGSGDRFVDTVGKLITNLEAAGIDPDEITHVVITHAHPDHIWGLRDGFDEPIFPGAEYVIGGAEIDYWLQDDLVNRVAPEEQGMVLGAVNSINTEGLEWTIAREGHEVAPGVSVLNSPGHTPGHICVHVESQGQRLIALGDSFTNVFMDFAHPDWVIKRDLDKEQTVATRKRLLDMTATDRITVLGYHFPFPGVGHVMREDDAFRFIPALWRWQG